MADASQFGSYIFNEAIFNEPVTIETPAVSYLEGRFGLRVAVYEPYTRILKAIHDSQQDDMWVRSVQFEYEESGCGAFKILVNERPGSGREIRRGDTVEISIMQSSLPWYSGRITKVPTTDTSGKALEYGGHGFASLFSEILVTETYTSQILSDIVQDLVETYLARTEIIFFPDRLSLIPVTVESIEFDRMLFKDCMKRLADLAHGYVFGVDEDRCFFFQPRMGRPLDKNRNKASHWVGYGLGTFTLKEKTDKIENSLNVKHGAISNNSNFADFTAEDLDSIAFFGQREKVLTTPDLKNADDAETWADHELETRAWPKITAQAKDLDLADWVENRDDLLKAEGFFRVEMARTGLVTPYYEPLNGYFRWEDLGQDDLYGANWLKRKFTARDGGSLGRVEFMVQKVGSPGDLVLSIYEGDLETADAWGESDVWGDSDQWDEGTLHEERVAIGQAAISDFFRWMTFDLADPVTVRKTVDYYLVLKATGGDSSNYYRIVHSTKDATFSGAYCSSTDSGGTWSEDTGKGLMFRAYLVHDDDFLMPVKKVAYRADPSGGLRADLDMGQVEMPLESEILDLLRGIKMEELLQQSNVADLS